jgi:tetratricopeptide (TPR) repeat protein/transcriptional regulator with XRE-family HTH domain
VALTDVPEFGVLLKRLRRDADLSQEELAARAHYSVGYIGMLERGTRLPLPATAALLADALALSETDRTLLIGTARHQVRAPKIRANPDSGSTRYCPFVGRARELAQLDALVGGYGPRLYMLAGEPGIGKTQLLREISAKAEAAGWYVVKGNCLRSAGQAPYAPLLDALEACVQSRSRDQLSTDLEGCGQLVRLLPELAEIHQMSQVEWTLPPSQERRLVFHAVRRFLANVAGPAGTLLALDDLQWAGADTFDLLTSLMHAREGVPLAVLGTYRDTDIEQVHHLHGMLVDLSRDGLAERIQIGELDQSEARALVMSLLGNAPVPPQIVGHILERAGGVPFFLVSCALSLRGEGERLGESAEIPWDVAESIRQRLAFLPAGTQELLGVAAVIGPLVPRGRLVAIMQSLGWEEHDIVRGADRACKVRLLVEHSPAIYQFAHDLIREVVLGDLGTAYCAMLHTRVAESMEGESGSQPEQLAYHFARGGQSARARHYLKLAGDHAASLHAYAEAETHYRTVVEQLQSSSDAALTREKLARMLILQAKYSQAIAELEPALASYLRLGDLEGVGRTLSAIGDAYGGSGAAEEGLARLQSYMDRLVVGGLSSGGQARLYLTLTELFHVGGRNAEQLAASEQAACIARDTEDYHMMAEAQRQEGLALLALGLADKAAEALLEAIRLAEKAGDLWQLSQAVGAVAMTRRIQGEHRDARDYFDRALEIARQIGQPTVIAYLTFLRGELLYLMGEWKRAYEDLQCAEHIVDTIGSSWASLYPPLGLGLIALAEDDREKTKRYLEHDAVEAAIQEGNLYVIRWAQPNLAERDLLDGRPEAALARLQPWLDRPGQVESDVTAILPFLAWAHLQLGETEKAQDVITATIDRASRGGHRNALVDCLRVQGMVALRLGRFEAAEEAISEAVSMGERMPYPHTVAKARYAYGLLCTAQGNMESAVRQFQEARAICLQLGEGLFRQHIERELGRAQALLGR